jgi:branched-chain amino acid aminotransferase
MQVEERDIHVSEIISGIENNTLSEAFGVGTAATIAQIQSIGYKGMDYNLPAVETREFSNKMSNYLNDYKRGRVEDKYDWLMEV